MSSDKPHILIVEARFYDDMSDALLDGARHALEAAGATFDVVTVPGALEIPAAIAFARAGRTIYDGYVALGMVIRGETYHFELVCNESARGLTDLAIADKLAIGNGIMTVENAEQGWARADRNRKDKGGAAARAALAMIGLRERLGTR
ncbi:6,7-dimethyl-8-ribityllumazine synthase [Roseitalea porphyridii]|uniref:6,7-dimethyl-8-ribityllumazine synthase n=1 Tax=Roseitalea porphyridii TaxID=1852022 RepID=A0A4P6UZX5_9HYPH|nr:6,7-dimethyl-8-ribityllumazine synthase [Roseitalea porphyridii]QBK30365.1 6,7-dimethyl-8-ribityllumazine synthase [Roseitalea porphyridii]